MELNFLTDNAIIYVLIAWVAIFAVAKGLRLERYGFSIKPYSLTYKNYKVQDALVRLLGRTRRGVRVFADVSVIAGFIMMGYVFFFLFLNISNFFVEPDEFAELGDIAKAKGFLLVSSSPLTRSSYHADEDFAKLKQKRINNH